MHCTCSPTLAVGVVPPHTGAGYLTASSALLCELARTVRATVSVRHCVSSLNFAVGVVQSYSGGGPQSHLLYSCGDFTVPRMGKRPFRFETLG